MKLFSFHKLQKVEGKSSIDEMHLTNAVIFEKIFQVVSNCSERIFLSQDVFFNFEIICMFD